MKNEVKFRRQWDKSYEGTYFENETGNRITVPDLGLTVKQLMLNHTRGFGLGAAAKEPQYYGDLEIPRVTDFTDIEKNREYIRERELELQAQIDEEVAKKVKEKKEKEAKEKPRKPSGPSQDPVE